MPFALFLAGLLLPAPAPELDLIVEVPRSWMLGHERSPCPLHPATVRALLGPPDWMVGSFGELDEGYDRLGLALRWEYPGAVYSLKLLLVCRGVDPEAIATLRRLAPAFARPALVLLDMAVMPRPSLIEAQWSKWGMKLEWRCDP